MVSMGYPEALLLILSKTVSSSPPSPPYALVHCWSLLQQEQTRQHLLGQARHLLPCLSPLGPWPRKPAGASSSNRVRALTVSSGLNQHIGWGFYQPHPCHVHPGHSLLDSLSKPCLLHLLPRVCFIYVGALYMNPFFPSDADCKARSF